MDIVMYVKCIVVSLLGSAGHLFLKMDTTSKKAKHAKEEFSSRKFMKEEGYGIVANVCFQMLYIFLIDEIVKNYPAIENWVLATNAFVGYAGSSVASKVFGAANKKLDKVIDEKTK